MALLGIHSLTSDIPVAKHLLIGFAFMELYNQERKKQEPFHDVEELPLSDYDSETEDLPLSEARYAQRNTFERALAYSQVLFAKSKLSLQVIIAMNKV